LSKKKITMIWIIITLIIPQSLKFNSLFKHNRKINKFINQQTNHNKRIKKINIISKRIKIVKKEARLNKVKKVYINNLL
jgi:predicted nucleic acid-binding protein